MAKIYANKIMTSGGSFTIDDVPERLRAQVLEILIEKGFAVEEEA